MSTVTLRDWQARCISALQKHKTPDFLLVACPASGKTRAGVTAATMLMTDRGCNQLVVVCPTVVVRDQWVTELESAGFFMHTDFPTAGWPDFVHGVCTTYAQVAQRAERFAAALQQRRTVVILDEVHHVGDEDAWGEAVRVAFTDAVMRLSLSGTPFRSDETPIPFVRYHRGRSVADFMYDYRRALREDVCRPVEFCAHDGEVTWIEEGAQTTARFGDKLSQQLARRRLRAALDPSKAYLRHILLEADRELQRVRADVPDAAGLVVADSQEHARQIALQLQTMGRAPVVATSDTPRSHHAIRAFAAGHAPWLVSVRMVSEGVDIPRLTVIAWATVASTELLMRQVAGRVLRTRPEYDRVPAVVHMPADPRLVLCAEGIDKPGGAASVKTTAAPARVSSSRARARRSARWELTAVEAVPLEGEPVRVRPRPAAATTPAASEFQVVVPGLPPSPTAIAAKRQARLGTRGETLRLLAMYAELQRAVDPTFTIVRAHMEMAEDVADLSPDAPDELVAEAAQWARERIRMFARSHPDVVRDLAASRRSAA